MFFPLSVPFNTKLPPVYYWHYDFTFPQQICMTSYIFQQISQPHFPRGFPCNTLVVPNFTVYPIKAIVEAMARFFMIHTIYAKDAKEGYSQQGMNSQYLKSSCA